jgi:flagellar motor switch protein FliN/FliY
MPATGRPDPGVPASADRPGAADGSPPASAPVAHVAPTHGRRPDPFASMHDVICSVEVVLGSTRLTVRDCLQLARHSVLRLAQSAGAELQVTVNGVPIAQGEVVIVDDSTAIRVTSVLPPPGQEGRP